MTGVCSIGARVRLFRANFGASATNERHGYELVSFPKQHSARPTRKATRGRRRLGIVLAILFVSLSPEVLVPACHPRFEAGGATELAGTMKTDFLVASLPRQLRQLAALGCRNHRRFLLLAEIVPV